MAVLPFVAHGDTFAVVQIEPKYEGKGEARRIIGTKFHALLPFDFCARVPITIEGLNPDSFPAPEVVTERNMQLKFLMAKFQNLVISFRGVDTYGTVSYRGTASDAEIIQSK